MDQERLKRIRNIQSTDWYAAVLLRPLSVAIMLVVADWRWLTPNRVTSAANAFKLAGAALVFWSYDEHVVLAVVLLQVGVLLDHLDGTLARYRGTGSVLGSFYDKVSDAMSWFVIVAAIAWVAYDRTGNGALLIVATAAAYALLVRGYMKWVIASEQARLDWLKARNDPAAAVARHLAPPKPSEPPQRSLQDWVAWIGRALLNVYQFDEIDMFFWVGLFLVLDEPVLLVWLLGITQGIGLLVMTLRRLRDAHRVDVRRREATR